MDIGGWDTHVQQGSTEGQMPRSITNSQLVWRLFTPTCKIAIALTVVTMSEFGRRVEEKHQARGTDHGHRQRDVCDGGGQWRQSIRRLAGLSKDNLYGPGDLAITTDFRDVIGEIVRRAACQYQYPDVFSRVIPPSDSVDCAVSGTAQASRNVELPFKVKYYRIGQTLTTDIKGPLPTSEKQITIAAMDLFEHHRRELVRQEAPLAARMRTPYPRRVCGTGHIVARANCCASD